MLRERKPKISRRLQEFIDRTVAFCRSVDVSCYVRQARSSTSCYLYLVDRAGTKLKLRVADHPGNPMRILTKCDWSICQPTAESFGEIASVITTKLRTKQAGSGSTPVEFTGQRAVGPGPA